MLRSLDLLLANAAYSLRRYSERLPKAWTSSLISSTPLQRLRSRDTTASSTSLALDADVLNPPIEDAPCSEAMVKSYSLLFGLGCALFPCLERTSLIVGSPLQATQRRALRAARGRQSEAEHATAIPHLRAVVSLEITRGSDVAAGGFGCASRNDLYCASYSHDQPHQSRRAVVPEGRQCL